MNTKEVYKIFAVRPIDPITPGIEMSDRNTNSENPNFFLNKNQESENNSRSTFETLAKIKILKKKKLEGIAFPLKATDRIQKEIALELNLDLGTVKNNWK